MLTRKGEGGIMPTRKGEKEIGTPSPTLPARGREE
jgi:hypothetical protein